MNNKSDNQLSSLVRKIEIIADDGPDNTNGRFKIEEEKIVSEGFVTWRFDMTNFPHYNIRSRLCNGIIILQASQGANNDIWWVKKIRLPPNAETNVKVTMDGEYLTLRVPIKPDKSPEV